MPLSLMTLSLVDSPVTLQEGVKILERDDYRCQYCGLDGRASFEHALVMRLDFVVPLIALEGGLQATGLLGSFFPLREGGTTESTRLTKAFSKVGRPASLRHWQGE